MLAAHLLICENWPTSVAAAVTLETELERSEFCSN